jgi:hypothetical protein
LAAASDEDEGGCAGAARVLAGTDIGGDGGGESSCGESGDRCVGSREEVVFEVPRASQEKSVESSKMANKKTAGVIM